MAEVKGQKESVSFPGNLVTEGPGELGSPAGNLLWELQGHLG